MQIIAETQAYIDLGKILFLRTLAGFDTRPALAKQLLFSVKTGKIRFLESDAGALVGYVAWASISREALLQLRASGRMPNYLHEWMEGSLSLVIDLMLLPEWQANAPRLLLAARKGHRTIVTQREGFGTRRYTRRIAHSAHIAATRNREPRR
jgi:hypothetical protein